MGRVETPVSTPNWALLKLAIWLREHRRTAHLTYLQLAELTTYSAATLSRATTGERVPRLPVVEAYAHGCGASVGEAREMWRAARVEEQKLTRHPRSLPVAVPRPDLVQEPSAFIGALQALYHKSGALPLAEMERRAGGQGRLPHSTLHRMVNGASMLRQSQLTAFLEVCGVPERDRPRWHRAWVRAWRTQRWQQYTAKSTALHRAVLRSLGDPKHLSNFDGMFFRDPDQLHERPILVRTQDLDRLRSSMLAVYGLTRSRETRGLEGSSELRRRRRAGSLGCGLHRRER